MRHALLVLPLTGCGGVLTTYFPPPVNVGDIADKGDLEVALGPTALTAAYGVVDHISVRASGDAFSPIGTSTSTNADGDVTTQEVGATGWDGRLGIGYGQDWAIGKERSTLFVVNGALDLGGGHIEDSTYWDSYDDDGLSTERFARLSASSFQAALQGTVALQWRAGTVGGGLRVVGEGLFDDGKSEGIASSALGLGRAEPFVYGRAGWAPFFVFLQAGLSIQLEHQLYLDEATDLYATSSPVFAAFGIEGHFDRLGGDLPLFHAPTAGK